MSSTVDVNVLVYASDGMSPFHDRARELVERMTTGPEIAYLFWPVDLVPRIIDAEEWARSIEINLIGAYYATRPSARGRCPWTRRWPT